MAKKYTKVGSVWRDKKDPTRISIQLGNPKSEKYGFNAQVAVFKGKPDAEGNGVELLGKQVNGYLSVFAPKGDNAPDKLVGDIMMVEEGEE